MPSREQPERGKRVDDVTDLTSEQPTSRANVQFQTSEVVASMSTGATLKRKASIAASKRERLAAFGISLTGVAGLVISFALLNGRGVDFLSVSLLIIGILSCIVSIVALVNTYLNSAAIYAVAASTARDLAIVGSLLEDKDANPDGVMNAFDLAYLIDQARQYRDLLPEGGSDRPVGRVGRILGDERGSVLRDQIDFSIERCLRHIYRVQGGSS